MDYHDSLIWKCVYEGHHELRHFGEICQGAITNLSGWLVESQLHWEQCHMPTMVFCCKRESISSRRVFFIVVVSSKKNTRQKGDATNFFLSHQISNIIQLRFWFGASVSPVIHIQFYCSWF